jgi:hypothetical protein
MDANASRPPDLGYSKLHTWTPTFAKLSINDFEKVKIAAIHPDFR